MLFTALDDGEVAERWLAGRDAHFMERLQVGMRAVLLGCVIDPLADWVEVAGIPSTVERTRAHRERFHRWALQRYRELY